VVRSCSASWATTPVALWSRAVIAASLGRLWGLDRARGREGEEPDGRWVQSIPQNARLGAPIAVPSTPRPPSCTAPSAQPRRSLTALKATQRGAPVGPTRNGGGSQGGR